MIEAINPQIFREYDIRGLVDKDLTQDSTERIGKGIGTYIRRNGGKTLTVGYDMRVSSIPFRDSLIRGINSTGCDVINIEMVPTPVAYFSLHHLKPDGGVMITGSHILQSLMDLKLATVYTVCMESAFRSCENLLIATTMSWEWVS